jgi:hypothetical protein
VSVRPGMPGPYIATVVGARQAFALVRAGFEIAGTSLLVLVAASLDEAVKGRTRG